MKRLLLSFILLFIVSITNAQTGSILLKTGTGTLISSHGNIQEAYTAIPDPVAGAYLIEITAPYDASLEIFPILLTAKTGSSPTNTITIRPAAGNTGETISGSASGSGGFPIINFSGCQYVTLDGRPGGTGTAADLKIENTSTAGTAYTVRMTSGASYNKLIYCNTVNYTNSTAGARNVAVEATPIAACIGNLISNCVIDGGRSTIGIITTGTGPFPSDSTTIQNCIIKNWGYCGIWFLGAASNTTVRGNEMFQDIASSSSIQYAIQFAVAANQGTTLIEKNKLYNLMGTANNTNVKGIFGPLPAGANLKIINNFISMALDNPGSASIYAIQLTGSNDYNTEILYNTIYLGGVHSGGTAGNVLSAGIVKGGTGAAAIWTQKNNIVVNKRTGGSGIHTTSFISSVALIGTLDVDYNTYYAFGDPGSFHADWNSVTYNDLAQYKAAATPNEQNTKFNDVNFVSLTNLHLAGSSIGDQQLIGMPIAGITTDIDGQTRNASFPYRGADEGDIVLPVELLSFNAAVDKNDINLFWRTSTEINNSGFGIERSKENGNWMTIGFAKGQGTTTSTSSYMFKDKNVPAGRYNYRLKQMDYNGAVKYLNLNSYIDVIAVPEYSLLQNYPNPFNPATTISYSLAEKGLVTVKLYDIIGTEVAVILNEVKEPGKYSLDFNAKNLTSGVYFYKLSSGNFVSSKKMIILK